MTLSYETAKDLKDAGFPQYGKGGFYKPPVPAKSEEYVEPTTTDLRDNTIQTGHGVYIFPERCKYTYTPTLEELIEACGDDFRSVHRIQSEDKIWWNAHAAEGSFGKISRSGEIPLEAVASLWLAVNKIKR